MMMFPLVSVPRLRSLPRCRRGTAAVEFALVAIPLFMFLFGIIEMGRVLWLQNALHYSVEEASRCAAVDSTSCGNASQIESFAASRSGYTFSNSVFSDPAPSCTGGSCCVSGSYTMNLVIPFVTLAPTLSSSSCFPTSS
jgi:Flp pilus assembly protein TadG